MVAHCAYLLINETGNNKQSGDKMSMNSEIQRLSEEVEALLAAAKAIPHPANMYELTVTEYVAEVQRDALLAEYENRSGILMDMMNERNMLNGATGDY